MATLNFSKLLNSICVLICILLPLSISGEPAAQYSAQIFSFNLGVSATTINVVNQCSYTVWPASWSTNSGGGGSVLSPGGTWALNVGAGWSGRVWGRTGCNSGGTGCAHGDCGGLVCTGSGQPASLLEMTVDGGNNLDYYDISIIDAFNLPMRVVPSNGGCTSLTCSDANCPQPPIYRVPDCSGCTQGCSYGTAYTLYLC